MRTRFMIKMILQDTPGVNGKTGTSTLDLTTTSTTRETWLWRLVPRRRASVRELYRPTRTSTTLSEAREPRPRNPDILSSRLEVWLLSVFHLRHVVILSAFEFSNARNFDKLSNWLILSLITRHLNSNLSKCAHKYLETNRRLNEARIDV